MDKEIVDSKEVIFDFATGEEIVTLIPKELVKKGLEENDLRIQAEKDEQAKKENQKKILLEKLGITEEEAKLLLS